MDVKPLKLQLVGFRAKRGRLAPPFGAAMRIEHAWVIDDERDEITLTLTVTLSERDAHPENLPEEYASATVTSRYAVPGIREHRNALPEALYLWIGHTTYNTIGGVFLARAEGTVLEQIMLPLPPDQAFLPQSGLRSISIN